MWVYDIDGYSLTNAYDIDGTNKSILYDIDGNLLTKTAISSLKVMSYNVGHFCGGTASGDNHGDITKIDQWLELFGDQECDIIGLEENTNIAFSGETSQDLIFTPLGYNYGNNANGPFINSYVRFALYGTDYPIKDVNHTTFTTGSSYGYGYKYGYTKIDDKKICLVATHLPWQDVSIRRANHAELVNFLKTQEYFICFGDFNTSDKDNPDHTCWEEFAEFYEAEGFNCANGEKLGYVNTCWSSNSGGKWIPCDNIITSSNIALSDVYTVDIPTTLVSTLDHKMIVATATFIDDWIYPIKVDNKLIVQQAYSATATSGILEVE